jgi:hypothetical protein
MTNLYEKKGRRYHYWGNTESYAYMGEDVMRAGQHRLIYCPTNGERRYRHDVTPDTAAFLAAAQIAEVAMETALLEAARAQLMEPATSFTPAQLAIVRKFQADMNALDVLFPTWWTYNTAGDIARAGIAAVISAQQSP